MRSTRSSLHSRNGASRSPGGQTPWSGWPRQGRFLLRLRGHRPRPPLGWQVAASSSRHLPSIPVCVLSSREDSVIGIGAHPQHSAELDRLQMQSHPEVLGVGRQQEFCRDTMQPTTSPNRDPLTNPPSRSSRGCAGLQRKGSRVSTGPPEKARQGQPRARPGPARRQPLQGEAGRTRGGNTGAHPGREGSVHRCVLCPVPHAGGGGIYPPDDSAA